MTSRFRPLVSRFSKTVKFFVYDEFGNPSTRFMTTTATVGAGIGIASTYTDGNGVATLRAPVGLLVGGFFGACFPATLYLTGAIGVGLAVDKYRGIIPEL